MITNAGNNLQSLCYRQREKARAILDGAAYDDDFFAMILSATREEAEAEIEAVKHGAAKLPIARRCNPGLGHVIQERDLVQDLRDAIQTPSELPNLLRLTYGVWDTAVSPWLSVTAWEKCGGDYGAADLAGRPCHAALDLSLTGDMSAVSLVFPLDAEPHEEVDALGHAEREETEAEEEESEKGGKGEREPSRLSPLPPVPRYRQLAHFWIPEQTAEERKHLLDYRAWAEAGWLTIVPGAVIEYSLVREALAELFEKFRILSFRYDAMYAADTAQWVVEKYPDCEVVKFPQNIMAFAGPTAEYERLVLGGQLQHNKNGLLTWQAGHCKVWTDTNRNKRPVKPKADDIRGMDGIVAGVMALSGAWAPPEPPSAYEPGGADEDTVFCVEDLMEEEREQGEREKASRRPTPLIPPVRSPPILPPTSDRATAFPARMPAGKPPRQKPRNPAGESRPPLRIRHRRSRKWRRPRWKRFRPARRSSVLPPRTAARFATPWKARRSGFPTPVARKPAPPSWPSSGGWTNCSEHEHDRYRPRGNVPRPPPPGRQLPRAPGPGQLGLGRPAGSTRPWACWPAAWRRSSWP